ncbi:Crp/Fnr family transcriptional regulator [Alkalibacter mobilis]|uniref:Crp/Fnr family transcriptional regulator n=1 Tax=Alkalibacter mobilis TaxID=2787712 RepID=UPI00189D7804|nr:Crp/Fnr family transcriptional regulator [Alkalibacter mobilis]MBF7096402.1 Crp/Fnr family transcriptional regulator [Alkalibacter mobilis]
MINKYYKILEKNPLFEDIDDYSIDQLLSCLKPAIKKYKKNELIAMAGDPFISIGVILEGQVTVTKENMAGNKIVISLLNPGEMYGEMIAFSNQSIYPVTVEATKDTTVMLLDKSAIVGQCPKMCSWHKSLIQNMLKIVSNRALMLNKKVEYLSIKSMRGKLSAYFVDQQKKAKGKVLNLDMNRNELSDFLNVSRPSMSREMAKLREEGIIDYKKNQITILDLESLKEMAD